jgi:hypothetical protein
MRYHLLLTTLALSTAMTGTVRAETSDEPGTVAAPDEPGMQVQLFREAAPAGLEKPFRIELGFGWASLVVDPDVGEGFGGGLYLSYEFVNRVGAELSFFFSKNPYDADSLGEIGTSFLAGSLSLGPTVRLTPAGSRFRLTAELGLGSYVIIPYLLDNTWTLGISGGLTLSVRLLSWFGLSIKLRYHLFNLATISGPELIDLRALTKVGVIDRLEIPVCLAFYF